MQYTYNKLQDELQECNLAIQLSTGPQHEEIKVDTRPRSTDDDHAYDQQDEKEIRSMNFQDFMAPVVDDYIDCEKDLMNCPVVNRILHLLKYYKNIQSQSDMSLYEYMVTLDDNYGIPDVMEDWYHFKLQHPLIRTDFKYFENSVEINCVNKKQCICLKRYHRERGGEYYQLNSEIDHKNAILTDQMDSIHAYIFHSCASRLRVGLQNQYMNTNIYDFCIEDEVNDIKEDVSRSDVWYNHPQSVSECDIDQIICIANYIVADLDKLQPFQQEIVDYIKQSEYDGNKLTMTSRKEFMKDLTAHFGIKKLSVQFAKLYNGITKCDINVFSGHNSEKHIDISSNNYDMSPLVTEVNSNNKDKQPKISNKFVTSNSDINNYSFGTQYRYTPNLSHHPLYIKPKYSRSDVWYNHPQSVSECDIDQIICIANYIVADLDKLQPFQQEIVDYIKQSEYDGNKLT
eukprot:268769_1